MSERFRICVIFIVVSLVLESISYLIGNGFDAKWVTANVILVPACALIMPDRG